MAKKAKSQDGEVTVPAKRPVGRPKFPWTEEIEEYIITKMIAGLSLRRITVAAQAEGINPFPSLDTIMVHASLDEKFSVQYARAKDCQQDMMAEELLDIIDGIHPSFPDEPLAQRAASVELRKWVMGKYKRKKWGEVKVSEVTGADGAPLVQPQILDTRSLSPEAQAALYQALQIAAAQSEAEDVEYTEGEDDD